MDLNDSFVLSETVEMLRGREGYLTVRADRLQGGIDYDGMLEFKVDTKWLCVADADRGKTLDLSVDTEDDEGDMSLKGWQAHLVKGFIESHITPERRLYIAHLYLYDNADCIKLNRLNDGSWLGMTFAFEGQDTVSMCLPIAEARQISEFIGERILTSEEESHQLYFIDAPKCEKVMSNLVIGNNN